MAPDDDDHQCRWRDESEKLRAEMEELRQKFASLERRVLGPKSEKMPPMADEVRKARPATADDAKRLRAENAKLRANVPTEIVPVPVPAPERKCASCGNEDLKPVGNGTPSVTFIYIAAHYRRRIYQRETLSCRCGKHIVTAPCPDKIADRSPYSASFIASIIVQKCEDGIPIYRLEKQFDRLGIPMARSTMNDLFHRGATLLAPIAARILARVAASEIVFADETSLKMQSSKKRAFVWTFLGDEMIGFVFSPTRSGDVPVSVLGESQGELMADLYTGYNAITVPGRRRRAGCLAHARRKIFEANANPETTEALELIRDIYLVEHDAREAKIEGTSEHLALRRTRSRPLIAKLLWWARAQSRVNGPKTLLGKAARYLKRNRGPLTRFLAVAELPPDNNRSEAALRRVALGRKNFLFVGDEETGQNLASLYSIVATCVHNEVNPVDYITDVLERIGDHPQRDIDELLPDRWRPLRPS